MQPNITAYICKPVTRQVVEWFNYGMPRIFFVGLMVLAAGIDVRTRDLGIGGPASNPLEVMFLLALLLLLLDTVIYKHQPSLMLKATWNANPFVCLYFGWAFLAAVIGLSESLFVFRNLFPAFVLFAYLSFGVRKPADLGWLLFIFLLAALPNLLLGLSQYLFGRPFPVRMNEASAVKMDMDGTFVKTLITGLFNHPNAISIFLVPVFLVAFGIVFSRVKKSIWRLLLSLGIMLVAAILLYVTRSKGAWAWSILGIGVILAPSWLLSFRRAWIVQILVLIMGIIGMTLGSLLLGGAFRTMQTRIDLWGTVLHVLKDSAFAALFGNGQEAVWYLSMRLANLTYANAHNVFLNQAVYFGIPAMIFYTGIFVWGIRNAQVAFSTTADQNIRLVARISLAVLMAIAGQYFFEPASESSGLASEFLLFVGLAAGSARLAASK
jgi:O-antigen ligase